MVAAMGPMSERLVKIQALRAVAALLVVVAHAAHDADAVAARLGRAIMAVGQAFDWTFGIHLFFVISGLVMAISARGFGEPAGPGRFLLRRLLRIAPLYWLLSAAVVVGAALAPGLLNVPLGGVWPIVASFLFVPALRPGGEIRPALGQGWTLNYEMFFYLCFALAMTLPRRAAFVALTLGLSALVFLGRGLTPATPVWFTWTDGLLIEFLFGLWIGALRLRGPRAPRWLGAMALAAGVALALWMDPQQGRVALPGFVLSGVPAALIVAAAALTRQPQGEGALLRAAHLLGDASYSLYLVHPFVIRVCREVWLKLVGGGAPPLAFIPAATAASVAAGLVLYLALERPMTRALHARAAPLLRAA